MKRTISIFLFLCSVSGVIAQPAMPEGIKLAEPADYLENQEFAMEAIDWLINSPIDSTEYSRSEYNAFCMEWLSGHPTIKVELESEILPFAEHYPDLFYIHSLAAARYLALNPSSSKLEYNMEGLKAVCKSVKMSKGLVQNKALADIVKLNDENRLEGWVTSQLE